jgi:hypothetical protein
MIHLPTAMTARRKPEPPPAAVRWNDIYDIFAEADQQNEQAIEAILHMKLIGRYIAWRKARKNRRAA